MPRPTIRRWWLKAAAQGALSVVPGAPVLDERLRRRRAGSELEPDYFLSKWHHVSSHTRAATGDIDGDLTGSLVVELGTGWFPIVPVGLALRGADVVSVDATAHLDPARVADVLELTLGLLERGEITVPQGPRLDLLRDLVRGARDRPVSRTLQPLGITARLADARDLSGLPETHGAHLMVSNNTLEHIPGDVLAGIFTEFARVSAPGARMSHYVDLADHYAGVDPTIGEFNFLTLKGWQWRLANNRLHYQNRLRIADYRELLDRSGWTVLQARSTRRKRAALDGLDLVPPYDELPPRQLLVVKSHLVAERR